MPGDDCLFFFRQVFHGMVMKTDSIHNLDETIRRLRAELDGVQGAVLREIDAEAYQQKQAELQAAMREYYQTFYGDRVSMP